MTRSSAAVPPNAVTTPGTNRMPIMSPSATPRPREQAGDEAEAPSADTGGDRGEHDDRVEQVHGAATAVRARASTATPPAPGVGRG